jgi:hypothetical protein
MDPKAKADWRTLYQRVARETDEENRQITANINVEMDMSTVLAVVGHLELALTHPMNQGAAVVSVRTVIKAFIDTTERIGLYPACVEMMRIGQTDIRVYGGDYWAGSPEESVQ